MADDRMAVDQDSGLTHHQSLPGTVGEITRHQINLRLNSDLKRNAATALPHCRSDVQLVLGFSVCMAVIRQRDTIIGDY